MLRSARDALLPGLPLAGVAPFPGPNALVDPDLVGDGAAARADTCTDQRTLAAAEQSAGECAAGSGADDDLGAGVVAMVVPGLRGFGPCMAAAVLSVCRKAGGKQKRGGNSEGGKAHVGFSVSDLYDANKPGCEGEKNSPALKRVRRSDGSHPNVLRVKT